MSDDLDMADLLEDARAAGVAGLICVGTDPESSHQACELVISLRGAGEEIGSWATAGLHPHDASQGGKAIDAVDELITATHLEHPRVIVAVGECGLDYHYDYSPRDAQRLAFEAQIALAAKHGLTLVVHTREAWDDTIEIIRTADPPERIVMHCFTGGPVEAKRCLDIGAFLSFSGIVTFKGAPEVRDAAVMCPRDRLLVETDAPFLAPVPHRGKSNRPGWVTLVGEAVAEVRGERPADLAESSTEAARAAFALA